MNAFPPIEPPPVRAINVQTDARRSAYAVVDALDELEHQLGAYRALAALTAVNLADTPERLEQLQRGDLAVLLAVLNANLESCVARARDAAVSSAKGNAP